MGRSSRRQVLAGGMPSIAIAAALGACAGASPGAATESSARGRNCVFETLGAIPGPEYVEIARIALEGNENFGAGKYRDTRRFASDLREMVCELGGDAVKTEMDAFGVTVRAIVFRRATCSNDLRCQVNK